MNLLKSFLSLLYPDVCPICGNALLTGERIICTVCFYKLPKTNFHLQDKNPLQELFMGRVDLQNSGAFLNYRKGGGVQKLIHEFKYKSRTEIGRFLGECYGIEIIEARWINLVDYIIPIPLHEKKLRKRGFNQSEEFALGMSKILDIPVKTDFVKRVVFSETQTKKSKYKRWENVKGIFDVENPELLQGKHVLLVDDVITTGATIEAISESLLSVANVRLSVASMAYTAI